MIETARYALQFLVGENLFPRPSAVLARIPSDVAVEVPTGFRYSIATVVAHADFWQRSWLSSLVAERSQSILDDWRIPAADEWPAVREEFLSRLEAVVRLATADPFCHRMKSDEAACKRLLMIAEHDAYHIGQVVLLKRAVRIANEAGRELQ